MSNETLSIRSGEVWLDTQGKPIQAHGGSVYYFNDTFYFVGENKEGVTPGSGLWHHGVRCYSSSKHRVLPPGAPYRTGLANFPHPALRFVFIGIAFGGNIAQVLAKW
ncbi:MAG: hypothetical protein SFV15_00050, partial [Polyangiaceae bacterium]|nr:hypothetical protein [Polyangiaceae bacterium]